MAALTVGAILALRRWRPTWPGFILAVGAAAALAALFGLPVETIGSRFGGIPSSLPAPRRTKWLSGTTANMISRTAMTANTTPNASIARPTRARALAWRSTLRP